VTGAHATSSSSSSDSSFSHPQLTGDALYGLAGEAVRVVERHTEWDRAALLLSYLTLLANCCGHQPAEIDRILGLEVPDWTFLPIELVNKSAHKTCEVIKFAHELALRHLDPVSRELCALRSVFPPAELERTGAYCASWDELYVGPDGRGDELLRHPAGVPGIVVSRAEVQVQVTRLAVLYALADRSEVVDLPHLQAAMSAWRLCEASAAIFGTLTGNRDADPGTPRAAERRSDPHRSQRAFQQEQVRHPA
jgi:hypothetical protein